MKKKGAMASALLIAFAFIFFSTMMFIGCSQLREKTIEYGNACEGFVEWDSEFDCCEDCHKLNQDYFKYEFSGSMFGADIRNCYCNLNETANQIW